MYYSLYHTMFYYPIIKFSSINNKKSRLLKAKEKKSCAATIKDLPVKIVLPLDGLPDSNDLHPRERSR